LSEEVVRVGKCFKIPKTFCECGLVRTTFFQFCSADLGILYRYVVVREHSGSGLYVHCNLLDDPKEYIHPVVRTARG
jgi:hypothetical protein